MPCTFPSPQWVNIARAGLQSATKVPSQNGTVINWGSAFATVVGAPIYYNIYYNDDLSELFDAPQAFAYGVVQALIPTSLAPDGYFFGVKAAQLGIAENFSTLSNMAINSTAFAYPLEVSLTVGVDTTSPVSSVPVDGYSGYPLEDGYLLIGTDILFYSSIDTSTPAFTIADSDPFGCNDGYNHPVGTSVSLFKGYEDGNTAGFLSAGGCIVTRPDWATHRPGLEAAVDTGIGTAIQLRWGPATVPSGITQTYYNVFYSTSYETLFDSDNRTGITTAQTAIVPLLTPGTTYYFGVRATYFTDDLDTTSMSTLSSGLYGYPTSTVVAEPDGYYYSTETAPLIVNTTEGFPGAGMLVVNSEVLTYDSKTSTSFNITQRDAFDFGLTDDHANDSVVALYWGIEDENTTSFKATPSWDKRSPGPNVDVSGELQYLQGEDGYRTVDGYGDNLTEDHSDFENENSDFDAQPFCGYRSQNFVNLYTKNACGTYFGGQFGGSAGLPGPRGGGIDLNEVNLQREEFLLGLTGEPFILLRRKRTGKFSASMTHRHEHPQYRYPGDYGANFEGGYDRYIHPREIRPGVANPNGLIMLRVEPYDNDLELHPELGLRQVDQLRVWGSAIPPIKDRDVLVRYITDNDFNILEEGFRYVVEYVNRNKILFGRDGRQQMTIRKLDKTEEVMKFPITLV